MAEPLTQRELLDMFDRTEAYPEIRAAIHHVLQPAAARAAAPSGESVNVMPENEGPFDRPGWPAPDRAVQTGETLGTQESFRE